MEGSQADIESEILERLKAFSLSQIKNTGVELVEEDVKLGVEAGRKSLVGKVFGDKKTNFLGVNNSMMRLRQHKEFFRSRV